MPCRFIAPAVFAFLVFGSTETIATPISVGAFAFRQTGFFFRGNEYDAQAIVAVVEPNPINDGPIGDATSVIAEQNGTVVALPYLNSPAFPTNYGSGVFYDPALTGPWTVTASNFSAGITGPSSNSFRTRSIGAQGPIPYVDNMKISGSVSEGMILSWQNPPNPAEPSQPRQHDGTRIFIEEFDPATGARRIVDGAFLTEGVTTYAIPEEFSGSSAAERLRLTAGQPYIVSITNIVFDDDGLDIARAQKNFEFTATAEAIDAFLPTVDSEGKYIFDFDVVAGERYNIDPLVAVGYDYWVGDSDPLFASVIFPEIGDSLFDLLVYNSLGEVAESFDDIFAGEVFDFLALGDFSSGVAGFGVRGIETSAMLDPADTTAFVTTVSFTEDGRFTGSMTPITQAVPAPSILLLLGTGFFLWGSAVIHGRTARSRDLKRSSKQTPRRVHAEVPSVWRRI